MIKSTAIKVHRFFTRLIISDFLSMVSSSRGISLGIPFKCVIYTTRHAATTMGIMASTNTPAFCPLSVSPKRTAGKVGRNISGICL